MRTVEVRRKEERSRTATTHGRKEKEYKGSHGSAIHSDRVLAFIRMEDEPCCVTRY
jgi:hypothetical protein